MCGIVGFNFPNKEKLIKLNNLLRHRGPDQEGYFIDDLVSLAHKRLSVIDLSEKGKQPMISGDRKYVIIFNGEIYNFLEIKKELQKKGYKFISETDTEVVLNAYIEWQENCLLKFNGQFAFCIYDIVKKNLFLARDRMGIKPLYYYSNGGRFIFGSELKVILKSNIKKAINQHALNHYLFFGCTPSEETIIQRAKKILPGHYLIFNLEKNKIVENKKYWEIEFADEQISEDEAKEKIYKKLDESVKKRLVADVPVGAFLSGGIDSSIIVYFMKKYVQDLKTFSIKFDYEDYNESDWARIVSNKFKTDHHEIEFNANDVKKFIPNLVYIFDEPFGDPSMIPTYLVSKVAKKHVTVCLSGTGGDELFIGYPRYEEFLKLKQMNKFPTILKNVIIALYSLYNKDKSKKLSQLLTKNSSDVILYLKLFSHLFRDKKELDLNINDFSFFEKHFKHKDDLTNLLNFDQNEYIPNDLLVKEDRATLGVSLEGRVPFLDHELVEFVNNIPLEYKSKKYTTKCLLKEVFKGKLPNEILYRKKQGFGIPLKYYFRNELKDFAYNNIFEFNDYQYYDKKVLKNMWNKHQRGISDYSRLFWVILMFNLWYKKWIKE